MKKIHFLILIGLTLLLSCNVHFEKRLYNKGYHVDIIAKNNKKAITTAELSSSKNLLSSNPSSSNELILTESEIISTTKEIEEILNPNGFPKEEIVPVQKNQTVKSYHKSDVISRKTLSPTTLIANKLQPVQDQKKDESGDILLYLTVGLIALASIATLKFRPKRVIKITRWAKANPTKNKWLIAGMQVPMVFLTVMSGYNLKQLGYELSDTLFYVSAAIAVIGLLSSPFKSKRGHFAIPKMVTRRRLIYLTTILASVMMAVSAGNKIEEKFPNSPAVSIIKAIDQSIFHETKVSPSDVSTPDTKTCNCKTSRKVAGGATAIACGLVAFYTFLLICFGIGGSAALIAFGAIFLMPGIAMIIGGLGILALVVWLFYKLYLIPCRKREKKEKVKKVT